MRRQFPLRPAGAARRPGPARDTARSSCAPAPRPERPWRPRSNASRPPHHARPARPRRCRARCVPGTRGCAVHAPASRSMGHSAGDSAPGRPRSPADGQRQHTRSADGPGHRPGG
ncbi:hypothetical protein G6F68_019995 [Rhizopus microsporus]|nr:hypothetical protein G6F68_019995 [Rhizopus microsporus]